MIYVNVNCVGSSQSYLSTEMLKLIPEKVPSELYLSVAYGSLFSDFSASNDRCFVNSEALE